MKYELYINENIIGELVGEFLKDERNRTVRDSVRTEIDSIVNYMIAKRRDEIEDRIWKQIEFSISDAMISQGGRDRINRMADILNRVIKKEAEKYGASL